MGMIFGALSPPYESEKRNQSDLCSILVRNTCVARPEANHCGTSDAPLAASAKAPAASGARGPQDVRLQTNERRREAGLVFDS